MEKFIYFSVRLMEKLNAVYNSPITFVSGRPGIGKSFAIQTYLETQKAETIWHASKAADFASFLREFRENYAVADNSVRVATEEWKSENANPAGAAVEIAVVMKRHRWDKRLVYVLEYQETRMPEEILEFLNSLSNQRVRGLHIILITRQTFSPALLAHMSANSNQISEETFLLTATEIKQAFTRNGITLGDAEGAYLYLQSAGFMPELRRLYRIMYEKGKAALYGILDRDAFPWDGSQEWRDRFHLETDIWRMPTFDGIRRLIERMNLEEASIAIERMRMKSKRYSPEWDVCEQYSTVLQALNGRAKTALDELNQGFELRAHQGLYQSAHRINLAQIQLRIFLGEHWFDAERELIASFASLRLYEGVGISKNCAGLALWRAKEYRKIIAMFDEASDNGIDIGFRDFLLATAYWEIGFEEEAARHFDAAWTATAEGNYLSTNLFYDAAMKSERTGKNRNDTAKSNMPPEFRAKLTAWHRAMRRNNAGATKSARQTLTMREGEIAECVARKMSNKEIASYLNISEYTVKTTLKHIFRKLDITSRRELQ